MSDGISVTHNLLDQVLFPSYQESGLPGYVNARSSSVFKQMTATGDQVTVQTYGGPGLLDEIGMEGDYPNASIKLGDAKVMPVRKFAKRLPLSVDFMKDDKFGVSMQAIKDMGQNARKTEDNEAFAIFRNATSTNPLYTTGDGQPLLSDSHTTLSGDTVDNYTTSDASNGTTPTPAEMDAAIQQMFTALHNQPAQDGTMGGFVGATLLVPPALYRAAKVATDSELAAGTANNDLNYISNVYPGLKVVSSQYISELNGGSDATMFLLADGHNIRRYVRQPVGTRWVDVKYNEESDHHFYLVSFKHLIVAPTYEGVVGHIFTQYFLTQLLYGGWDQETDIIKI